MGKFGITEEEATPLVISDREEGQAKKWLLAGRVLHQNIFRIQTIASALQPAWGSPRGLNSDHWEKTLLWRSLSHSEIDLPLGLNDTFITLIPKV